MKRKKYVIKIEVEYKHAPKGTGDQLVKNVEQVVTDLLYAPDALVDTWDVKVSRR